MTPPDLFHWLMQYHSSENLGVCLPYFRNGRITDSRGHPLREGSDVHTPPYHGVLIVANGDTLTSRLRSDRVIHDDPGIFMPLRTVEDVSLYFPGQEDSDGAYIYDGVNQTIARVGELNNSPPSLPANFDPYRYLPHDFVSLRGEISNDRIGTKTRLAIKLSQAYPNTDTYQVKRSPYGPLGMGKVTHFGKEGLQEEFFLQHHPASSGPFVDEEHSLVGIYRRYGFNGKNVEKLWERIVDPFARNSVNDRHHDASNIGVTYF